MKEFEIVVAVEVKTGGELEWIDVPRVASSGAPG